jgi:hypothetical protein
MSSFEGFTFSPTGTATGKSKNPKLDMDLGEVVKQDRRSTARPSGTGQRRTQQDAKPKPKATAKKSGAGSGKPEKRSYDLGVPESALRDILAGAGVDVPDDSTVKLVARRKPDK